MDVSDYKKRYGEPQSLEEILNYCAFLRGVGGLEHRTLHEFNWFVSSVIFGQSEYDDFQKVKEPKDKKSIKYMAYKITRSGVEEGREIYNKYKGWHPKDNDHSLLEYAQKFLEYCEEEYA